jgi:hypothetical protein
MIIDQLPSSSPLPLPIPKQPTIQQSLPRQRTMGFVRLKELFQYLRGITQTPIHLLRFVGRKEEQKLAVKGYEV